MDDIDILDRIIFEKEIAQANKGPIISTTAEIKSEN